MGIIIFIPIIAVVVGIFAFIGYKASKNDSHDDEK